MYRKDRRVRTIGLARDRVDPQVVIRIQEFFDHFQGHDRIGAIVEGREDIL